MIMMKKSMKIKFNADGDLALEKTLRMCIFND